MSETGKHTPGPWRVNKGFNEIWGDRLHVADARYVVTGPAETAANAELIAAAPELADALEAALLEIGRHSVTVLPVTEHGEALRKAGRL